MPNQELHLSDQDLLSASDGEISGRAAARVRAHLAACWTCRTRLREMEAAVADVVHLERIAREAELPPIEGPRALLKLRLEAAARDDASNGTPLIGSFARLWAGRPALVYSLCAILVLACAGVFVLHAARGRRQYVPLISLTPGATRLVSTSDVCGGNEESQVRTLPVSLQKQVFAEYGIANYQLADYEVDHLITPELGGSDDIQNLWPEPYSSTDWNARVKDQLENYLHEQVCRGNLDLATAQRDIAVDWVAAYKKYFRTNRPH